MSSHRSGGGGGGPGVGGGGNCRRGRGRRSAHDVLEDLSSRLRQERLYVAHEKAQLEELNAKVRAASSQLSHTAWLAHWQRDNLDRSLATASSDPEAVERGYSLLKASTLLEKTFFEDAYKELKQHEVVYSELLASLRGHPRLLATILVASDKNVVDNEAIVRIIFGSLYGSCLLKEDERLVSSLLQELLLRGGLGPNPRKLLRQGHSCFGRLCRAFASELYSARLFLTSALHEPILAVLSEVEEVFLDIDPAKMLMRFPPQERLKRFGKEGSPEFLKRTRSHRQTVCAKLEAITGLFVQGIRDSLHCFPGSLSRLLRAMYACLDEPRQAYAVCVDVVFALLVCPAMVDPNPLGIIDAPLSYVARSNLMQVAQILQVLALWKWEEVDPRLMDLYSRFDKEALSSVVDALLEDQQDGLEEDEVEDEDGLEHDLKRTAVLITRGQLDQLVAFLRAVHRGGSLEETDSAEVANMLAPLPDNLPPTASNSSSKTSSKPQSTKKQLLSNRLSAAVVKRQGSNSSPASNASTPEEVEEDSSSNKGEEEPPEPETVLVIPLNGGQEASQPPGFLSEEHVLSRSRQRVVRMNDLDDEDDEDEDDIDEGGRNVVGRRHSHGNATVNSEENSSLVSVGREAGEKRTRFSLSHDEGSIGNTSDNLEAISEAASNHSVASSLEDEPVDPDAEDPIIDNLSDMVSANVSGRGTPNVSGRDTPSSQVTEDGKRKDDRPQEGEAANRGPGGPTGGPEATMRKVSKNEAAADLEEKFGRFEIKNRTSGVAASTASTASANVVVRPSAASAASISEQGDETVSMVSDTWSTDVLASDTEGTLGESDLRGGRRLVVEPPTSSSTPTPSTLSSTTAASAAGMMSTSSMASSSAANLLDVAETASEAWSMDVLASDTESLRLGEFDNEDTASVARSDDTRFTDDTNRSDDTPLLPDQQLQPQGPHGSLGGGQGQVLVRLGAGQRLRPSRAAAVEQWARQSSGQAQPAAHLRPLLASSHIASNRRGSDSASILKKPEATNVSASSTESSSEGGPNKAAAATSGLAPSVEVEVEVAGGGGAATTSSLAKVDKQRLRETGAIPKSISFDKAVVVNTSTGGNSGEASPSSEVVPQRQNSDKSFFKSWKLPKIGRHRGGGGPVINLNIGGHHTTRREEPAPPQQQSSSSSQPPPMYETSDEILAKYRRAKDSEDGLSTSNEVILGQSAQGGYEEVVDERLIIDPSNVEASFAFEDAKRKLRLMLAEADLGLGEQTSASTSVREELVRLLQVQLAEAQTLQERGAAAQLHEALRCLRLFDEAATQRLVRGLREDYRRRSPYLAYLGRCRQGLLATLARQQRLLARLEADRHVCTAYLASLHVRLYLDRKCGDAAFSGLLNAFHMAPVPDEKIALVEAFLSDVSHSLEADLPDQASIRDEVRLALERAVVGQVHLAAMYPNGEADMSRDTVLCDHIRRLVASGLTPGHRDLRIARCYHYEAPWPSAQAELRHLAAYRTPQDKVACVARASRTIMNLLSMACDQGASGGGKSPPAADDFLPVLVYVVIMANPPALLSTVQYVDSFYGSRLCGEEQYWWMQFAAAVEFIKTMDYGGGSHPENGRGQQQP